MENGIIGRKINQSLHEIYLGRVKAFLLEAPDGSLVLLDTGMPNSQARIIKYLNAIGKSVNDIRYILLTHSHIDHFGSASELKRLSNAMVGINDKGIKYIDGSAGVKLPVVDKRGTGMRFLLYLMKVFLHVRKPKFFKPDMVLKEGVFPEQMHINAKILETPGHTEDSISIYLPDSKTVIVGDLFFGKPDKLVLPVFYDDYIALLNSIKRIRDLEPDLICVSHGKNHHVSDISESNTMN